LGGACVGRIVSARAVPTRSRCSTAGHVARSLSTIWSTPAAPTQLIARPEAGAVVARASGSAIDTSPDALIPLPSGKSGLRRYTGTGMNPAADDGPVVRPDPVARRMRDMGRAETSAADLLQLVTYFAPAAVQRPRLIARSKQQTVPRQHVERVRRWAGADWPSSYWGAAATRSQSVIRTSAAVGTGRPPATQVTAGAGMARTSSPRSNLSATSGGARSARSRPSSAFGCGRDAPGAAPPG
jgi:hypothetical protein